MKLKPLLIMFLIVQLVVESGLPIMAYSETIPPSVTIDSPLIQGNSVSLFGTARRAGEVDPDGVDLELIDNSSPDSPIIIGRPSNGLWEYPLYKSEGIYNYTIRGTDIDDTTGAYPTNIPFTLTVDGTGPQISVTSSLKQSKNVTISGTVEDEYTTGNLITMELLDSANNPVPNVIYTAPTATNNSWSFILQNELAEDSYQFKIKATDSYNNTNIEAITISVGVRPQVASIKVNLSNKVTEEGQSGIDILRSEQMNYVRKDTSITVTITDDKLLSADKIDNPILIYSSNGDLVTGPAPSIERVNDKEYKIIFVPNNLKTSTTYYIYINPSYIDLSPGAPSITDAAGNPLYPVIRKFTTERSDDTSTYTDIQKQYHGLNDPHGNLTNNTNTCSNCHNTHASSGPKLEDTSFEYSTYNYCMACHDGTVAALPENMSKNGHFPEYGNQSVQKMATDCSTCHNAHLSWNAENPNLLDDHYVVENHPMVEGMTPDMFDTDKILCESCHEDDSGIVKKYVPKSPTDPVKVTYKVLHYRKATATGVSDDYALCFRCHDGTRGNITNIKQYYEDAGSKHRITAQASGSLVNTPTANDGHIPCAECHGTHGSTNTNIINSKIGHEDRRGFSTPAGVWDASTERTFCIKCHNGSTAIYGVTGKLLQTRLGHDEEKDKNTPCSSCHGGTGTAQEKAIRASHAPTTGTP